MRRRTIRLTAYDVDLCDDEIIINWFNNQQKYIQQQINNLQQSNILSILKSNIIITSTNTNNSIDLLSELINELNLNQNQKGELIKRINK